MAITYPRTMRGQFEIRESASWGADTGTWTYLKTKEVGFPSGLDYVEGDDITQEDAEDVGSVILTPGDVTMRCGLHPAVSSWPTLAPVIGDMPPIFVPLKSLMGLVTVGGYGVTTTGNTTTVLQFDIYGSTPSALGWKPSDPILVRNAGESNIMGANVVKEVDDLAFTVTLVSPLPSAPGDGAICYGGFAAPKISTDTSVPVDTRWTGEATYDVRKALSSLPSSAQISAPYRGLAELSMTFHSAQPIPPDASESGGGAVSQTYDYPEASQVIAGGLYHWDGSSNRKLTGGIEIDFGVELSDVDGINAVDPNGIAAMVLTARKIRVSVKPALTSDAHALWEIFQNPTTDSVLTGWWGTGPRAWMFQVPQATIMAVPDWGDEGGKVILEATFGAAKYTGHDGSASPTTGIDSPFVLASLAGAAS